MYDFEIFVYFTSGEVVTVKSNRRGQALRQVRRNAKSGDRVDTLIINRRVLRGDPNKCQGILAHWNEWVF